MRVIIGGQGMVEGGWLICVEFEGGGDNYI